MLFDFVFVISVALGMSFVLTGSTIGFPLRLLAYHTLGKIGIGDLRLSGVFLCPYCNAWWGGLGVSALIHPPEVFLDVVWCLGCAFAACVVAAIVQAQWALAANDNFEGEENG